MTDRQFRDHLIKFADYQVRKMLPRIIRVWTPDCEWAQKLEAQTPLDSGEHLRSAEALVRRVGHHHYFVTSDMRTSDTCHHLAWALNWIEGGWLKWARNKLLLAKNNIPN